MTTTPVARIYLANKCLPQALREINTRLEAFLANRGETLNDKDTRLIYRTCHVTMFAADVIEDRCNTEREEGLREHYVNKLSRDVDSLIDDDQEVSLIDVLECHQICWSIINDFYSGATYKKSFFEQMKIYLDNRKEQKELKAIEQ